MALRQMASSGLGMPGLSWRGAGGETLPASSIMSSLLLLREISRAHERLSQDDAALGALEEYAERFPDDYMSFLWLAAHYKIRGELTLEGEYLERARVVEPTRITIFNPQIAELDLRVGAFDEAKAGFDRTRSAAVTRGERIASSAYLRSYYEYRGELLIASL